MLTYNGIDGTLQTNKMYILKFSNENKSSSSDMKMATSKAFEHLLNQVKISYLNSHLQQSPFAAIISLKKSLIKDENGIPLLPPAQDHRVQHVQGDLHALQAIVLQLEKENNIISRLTSDQ